MNKVIRETGRRIRKLRTTQGITQEQLGEKSGMSYKFVGQMERGEVNPSLESLCKVAEALNVGVRDLLPEERIPLVISPKDVKAAKEMLHRFNVIFKRLKP